jgi:predicted esterase
MGEGYRIGRSFYNVQYKVVPLENLDKRIHRLLAHAPKISNLARLVTWQHSFHDPESGQWIELLLRPVHHSMSSSAPRKLRIIALHGYTSNAFVLQRRMGAIRKACRDTAEFVYFNGPIRVEPITAVQSLDAPESSQSALDADIPLEEQPRAWWKSSDDGNYTLFDETIAYLNEEFSKEKESFDGVFGFSQGACFAALLASAFEAPTRYPKLKLPSGQGPLRFCIAVSGFRPRDASMQALFPSEGIQTPILHILGKTDQIVDAERSQTLVQAARNSRVEYHESGHVVPSQANFRNFYRDFIATFQGDPYTPKNDWQTITSPSVSGTSTPQQSNHNEDNKRSAL